MSIASHLSQDGQELTLVIKGRFDFGLLPAFKQAYEKTNTHPERYVIDLAQAEYLDSSALGMLLALRDHAGGDESQISIQHCNPNIKKILNVTKLNELFAIE